MQACVRVAEALVAELALAVFGDLDLVSPRSDELLLHLHPMNDENDDDEDRDERG